MKLVTETTWPEKLPETSAIWPLTEKVAHPSLDGSTGSELHIPLPLPSGTQLVLEEAFSLDCGHTEGGAFLLKETGTYSMVRKKRTRARLTGAVLGRYLTLGTGEQGEDVWVDKVELSLNLVAAQVVN